VLGVAAPVGNALLWRKDRLEEHWPPAAGASGGGKGGGKGGGASRGGTTRVVAALAGRAGSGLAALGPTAVCSVHLDATREETRVRQLGKCLEVARTLGTRQVGTQQRRMLAVGAFKAPWHG